MNKLAVVLGLSLIAVVFAINNAYATGWDNDPYYVNQNTKPNVSGIENFDVRQHHVKGWHMSKVCGLELCNGGTGTETMRYQGLTTDGLSRPDANVAFDGHFYIKGFFGNYTQGN